MTWTVRPELEGVALMVELGTQCHWSVADVRLTAHMRDIVEGRKSCTVRSQAKTDNLAVRMTAEAAYS